MRQNHRLLIFSHFRQFFSYPRSIEVYYFHCLLFLSNESSGSKVSFIEGNILTRASKSFDSCRSNEMESSAVNSNEIGWIIIIVFIRYSARGT